MCVSLCVCITGQESLDLYWFSLYMVRSIVKAMYYLYRSTFTLNAEFSKTKFLSLKTEIEVIEVEAEKVL